MLRTCSPLDQARAKPELTNLNLLISNLSAKTLAKWPNEKS